MKRNVCFIVFLMLAVTITGCSTMATEPERNIPDTAVAVELFVEPDAVTITQGKPMLLHLEVGADTGDVNGVNIYTKGPWEFILDKEIERGSIRDQIISLDIQLKEGEKTTVAITGTMGTLLKPGTYEFLFSAYETHDGKEAVCKGIYERMELIVLPE